MEANIKKGDKVYCIKTKLWKNIILNKKDKCYTILYVSDNKIYLATESLEYLINRYNMNNSEFSTNIFSEYFVTEKEYRKLKLEKLNENR